MENLIDTFLESDFSIRRMIDTGITRSIVQRRVNLNKDTFDASTTRQKLSFFSKNNTAGVVLSRDGSFSGVESFIRESTTREDIAFLTNFHIRPEGENMAVTLAPYRETEGGHTTRSPRLIILEDVASIRTRMSISELVKQFHLTYESTLVYIYYGQEL